MRNLFSVLGGMVLLALACSQAQAGDAAATAPAGGPLAAPTILAQVPPSPQRPMSGAGTVTDSSQVGTGSLPTTTAGRLGGTGAAVPGTMSQGRTLPGGAGQSSGTQSSGNQAGGGQSSGAPMQPSSPAEPAPPVVTPPPAAPPAPPAASAPPAVAPPSPGQPAAAGGGSAVVVVPQGARRITPQVTLRNVHPAARERSRTGKTRHPHPSAARAAGMRGGESSGAGQ